MVDGFIVLGAGVDAVRPAPGGRDRLGTVCDDGTASVEGRVGPAIIFWMQCESMQCPLVAVAD